MNKKIFFKLSLFLAVCFTLLSVGTAAFASTTPQIQTSSAINIQNNSATLNGYLSDLGTGGNVTVYFQWGTSASYGNQTSSMTETSTGSFNQTISGLSQNTTYHFRAVAQNSYGTVYGQDVAFDTGLINIGGLTANAGPDLYLGSGQTATLQGSANNQNVNYSWSCTGGILSNNNVAQPVYTAPYAINGNNQATYICTLIVSNNSGSSSDSMTIFANYNGTNNNFSVQTNTPTYLQNNSATLNGYLYNNSYNTGTYVWFQWGSDTNYGNNSFQQALDYPGPFFQQINNLSSNITYHYRAVAQYNGQTVYGQDTTFILNGSGNYLGSGTLLIKKQVINLTSGNLNWQASVNANPGDILSFAITLQANGQDVHNVFVRDNLPANLIYKGNLTVNTALNYIGNPALGINVGTMTSGEIKIISYQAEVAPAMSLSYGTTTLSNSAIITSTEGGTQTASASAIVNNSLVNGASTVATGLTNNLATESFFLPVMLIILMSWLYFSGKVYRLTDWINAKIN